MGDRNQETDTSDNLDDFFEPVMADTPDDDTQDLLPMSTEKQRLAAKRRRAEQRLEECRLRDELGYYDLSLDGD